MTAAALTLLMSTSAISAQNADNAALLYYQAFMVSQEPQDELTMRALGELLKGKAEPNEAVIKYVEQNRPALELAITAAEIPDCDWGLDFSQGTSMQIPHLSPLRRLSKTLLAEAKILASRRQCPTALGRCLTAHKIAAHAGDDMIISFLVAISISEMANESIQAILSEMPQNLQTLNWLKDELAKVEHRPVTLVKLKKSIQNDVKSTMLDLTKDRVEKILPMLDLIVALAADNVPRQQTSPAEQKTEEPDFDLEKVAADRIRAADERFLERNKAYWQDHTVSVIAALDLPYAEAYPILRDLAENPKKDAVDNTDATLAAVLEPHSYKIFHFEVKRNTFYNAIVTAVDIYILKAQTGQLPDALPAGSPKDLFSGKPFEYEKKDDGFLLRCRAKALDKEKKIHQYEFKLRQ
jgi:hypothetical protein